ncbi:MAG: hypothetical protein NTX84_00205, partial [Nitrospirae bacterium]|nr:hypothetical protein [Nitrospirota bacterium]
LSLDLPPPDRSKNDNHHTAQHHPFTHHHRRAPFSSIRSHESAIKRFTANASSQVVTRLLPGIP